jgi:ABC-type transport system substrate-binding protein
MKRNRKTVRLTRLLLTLGLVFALILGGCSGNGGSSQGGDTSAQTGGGASGGTGGSGGGTGGSSGGSGDGGGTGGSEDDKYGGVLILGITAQSNSLGDPPKMTLHSEMFTSAPAMETLARYDGQGLLQPHLAESWDVDAANKTITLHLRKGVKFHDGTDFNAEAVVWNIEKFREAGRAEVSGISTVEAVDDATVKITLETWNSSLLEAVTNAMVIVSPSAYEANGADWAARNPVGTGPFVFVSWDRDSKAVYKKNENYWQEGKPYLDGVELHYIADPMTAAAALERGEVHGLITITPDTAQQVSGFAEIIMLTSGIGAGADAIIFNTADTGSPLANVKVRQAIAHAIDIESLVKALTYGYNIPTVQWGLPGAWSYNPDLKGFPYDPERAKQLLAEAGYPDGFKTKITYITGPANQDKFTAVQSYLGAVGIEVELEPVDNGRFVALRAESNWGGMLAANFRGDADIGWHMPVVFGNLYGKGLALPDRVTELFGLIRSAADEKERQQYAHEVQKLIFQDETIAVPFSVGTMPAAVLPRVQDTGINVGNATQWTPENAWLKK